jgi:hypothetical protein
MSDYSLIIQDLEWRRLAFEKRNTVPQFSAKDRIRWNKILEKDKATRSSLSQGRKSIRTRAHAIANLIRESVGPEVLLLVLSSLNQDKLAKLKRETFVDALQAWWNNVSHPQALATVASQYFMTVASQNTIASVSTEQDSLVVFGKLVDFSQQRSADLSKRMLFTLPHKVYRNWEIGKLGLPLLSPIYSYWNA